MTERNFRYFPELDGLRAIAVTIVVLYHAFPQLLPSGFVGVDIFFVISGFLITGIILDSVAKETFSLWDFYFRRDEGFFQLYFACCSSHSSAHGLFYLQVSTRYSGSTFFRVLFIFKTSIYSGSQAISTPPLKKNR